MEYFRLPNYMAARFNLRIQNVHRGLLLGTGPIVDPGFCGHLLIPLHNLTSNRYSFRQGEGFTWFEFTKITPNRWDPKYLELKKVHKLIGELVEFPEEKKDRDPREYLRRASAEPIRSSISQAIINAEDSAVRASEQAEQANNAIRRWSAVGYFGVLAGLAAILFGGYQLINSVTQSIAQNSTELAAFKARTNTRLLLVDKINELDKKIDDMVSYQDLNSIDKKEIQEIKEKLESLIPQSDSIVE